MVFACSFCISLVIRPVKDLVKKDQDLGLEGLPRLPSFSCMQMKCMSLASDPLIPHGEQAAVSLLPAFPLTIVRDQPVLSG